MQVGTASLSGSTAYQAVQSAWEAEVLWAASGAWAVTGASNRAQPQPPATFMSGQAAQLFVHLHGPAVEHHA